MTAPQQTSEPRRSVVGDLMTIGELSSRTGVSVKILRRYDSHGLLYSAGRSSGNYRLFDESALWCVGVITGLRNLGLTMAEIDQLASVYLDAPHAPIGPLLADRLRLVKDRIEARMAELRALHERIEEFEAGHSAELAGRRQLGFYGKDPRARAT